jgi:hypothetical protein
MQCGAAASTRTSNIQDEILPTGKLREDTVVVCGVLGVFGVLLGWVAWRHELYFDEAQAWLIARDSHGFLDLFHHLRYEGHPAMWYLLIYPLSHFSASMVWMQAVNYVFSLLMAWLILSKRSVPLPVRVLLVFSVSIFFYMGVVTRSYMLAGMLLVASSRCLLAHRPRTGPAMVLLGLAINSHFLAIPEAAGIFIWLYWLAPIQSVREAAQKLQHRTFWISTFILGVSLILCYFTLRPAPDVYTPQYQRSGLSPLGHLLMGIGGVWHFFVLFPNALLSPRMLELLAPSRHPSFIAASLTVTLWLMAISALPSQRSRYFMLTLSLLWTASVWATVHIPTAFHVCFLFVGYVIALMMDAPHSEDQRCGVSRYARPALFSFLGMQVLICLVWCLLEIRAPFSAGKPAATWLNDAGLSRRPLIIQPDVAGPAILANAGIKSAYYPACRCRGSFVVFRKGRDLFRRVELEEVQAIQREYGTRPVVVSEWRLSQEETQRLGLQLIFRSPGGWFWADEDVFVYQSVD